MKKMIRETVLAVIIATSGYSLHFIFGNHALALAPEVKCVQSICSDALFLERIGRFREWCDSKWAGAHRHGILRPFVGSIEDPELHYCGANVNIQCQKYTEFVNWVCMGAGGNVE